MRRGSVVVLGVAVLLAHVLAAPPAIADTTRTPRWAERLDFDWSYGLVVGLESGYKLLAPTSPSEPVSNESELGISVTHRDWTHALSLSGAYAFRPWLGAGVEAFALESLATSGRDAVGPREVWFGPTRQAGFELFAEFRPWESDASPRSGAFFRSGVRWAFLLENGEVEVGSGLVDAGRHEYSGSWVAGCAVPGAGYRVAVGPRASFHVLGEVGLCFTAALLGLRLGGGFG